MEQGLEADKNGGEHVSSEMSRLHTTQIILPSKI
jgi:hypothetical protein